MDERAVTLGIVGVLSCLVGLAFLFWPSSTLALGDRVPVGLLFVIPGVIGIDEARRRL